VSGEDTTPDGVLRQAKPHHLQPIPLLSTGCAGDVMVVSAMVRQAIDALGAVHGLEVSQEWPQLFDGWDFIASLHLSIISVEP
jgi:hypothetical protein